MTRPRAELVARELASHPNVFLRTKVEKELGSISAGFGVAIGHLVTTLSG